MGQDNRQLLGSRKEAYFSSNECSETGRKDVEAAWAMQLNKEARHKRFARQWEFHITPGPNLLKLSHLAGCPWPVRDH
ncbi:hypothetical protein M407DRAFT_244761 [Tulasnella calospora MUT 4182]|uniref:Uncharacterized protein n=1 Tax=Tulasnella calospora MUT 4182 TaxID=1051891 RepID=A0A0C3LPX1_9AGAM|nr:hypothetical protein M407DRAFT_244761 [Tulasnella calospora MUT 4182]